MIPITLHLKNFLSYGAATQTISFNPYHLICLSGKNGHGKSALLDAMTWAIWGQARKASGTTKADAQLMRLGSTTMMVSLDFELNGTTYRVKREYTKIGNRPYAVLEFGIVDPATNTVSPLTDKTIKETQKRIEETIGLDFDSFINSAFLRQGNANEFSKRSPKERKDIIASILGLTQYETLRRAAVDRARTAERELLARTALRDRINEELKETTDLDQRLATHKKEEEKLTQQKQTLATRHQQLADEQKKLASQQQKRAVKQAHHNQLIAQQEELRTQLRTARTTWRELKRQQRAITLHPDSGEQKKQLTQQLEKLQRTQAEQLTLKEQMLHTQTALQKIEQQLEIEHAKKGRTLQVECERIKHELTKIESTEHHLHAQHNTDQKQQQKIERELETLKQAHQKSATQVVGYEERREQFDRRRSFYQRFSAIKGWLESECATLEEKEKMVNADQSPAAHFANKIFLHRGADSCTPALPIDHHCSSTNSLALNVCSIT